MATRWARVRGWFRRRGRAAGTEGRAAVKAPRSVDLGALEASRSVNLGTAEAAPETLAPPAAPRAAPAPSPSGAAAEVLAAVGAACELQERLQFDFRARDGTETVRDVEPYRLVRSGRHWYVLAFDVGRDDWRTFRLDRMAPRQPTGPRFDLREIPAGDDAPYLSTGGAADGAADWAGDGASAIAAPMAPDPGVVAEMADWARRMVAPGAAVVLDTETTDLPGAICEIAVVDAASGETLLNTLVDPGVPMSERAQAVHGIASADLVGAPTWPMVLPRLLEVSGGRQVLAYNVEFDAAVIRADTARYGLGLGSLQHADRWDCVMVRRAQTLPGGSPVALGAAHRARGDALAALQVLRDMAALSPVPAGREQPVPCAAP